jgi:hypothetical protein
MSTRVSYLVRQRKKGKAECIPVPEYYSMDELHSAFQAVQQNWRTSKHYHQLRAIFTSLNISSLQISRVIAFACSSFTTFSLTTHRAEIRDDIILQHSLILALRDILSVNGSGADKNIPCFAQDPDYKPSDERLLDREGIKVLEDPRAFLHVDHASVIISIGPDIPVRQIITDIARPSIIIWNKEPLEEFSGAKW